MQTNFSTAQLSDPAMAASEAVIRKCVHCGFCLATCPTYVLLGDELDSPRGRIYLMKDMLENTRPPSHDVVKHVDRCLSCLSCMTTCPSGVSYMHLVDHARAYIDAHYRRPWRERIFRGLLASVLPYPRRFRFALRLARWTRFLTILVKNVPGFQPLAAMFALAPKHIPAAPSLASEARKTPNGRVLILQGCAEPVLKPEVRAATVRVLNRAGYDVTFAGGEGCCGALVHHLGRERASLTAARYNVDVWTRELGRGALSAIIVTASGCGTMVKDYGFMLKRDPAYAERAASVSALTMDICEFLNGISMPPPRRQGLRVAYHSACALQHGQKVTEAPMRLLTAAGYTVQTPDEAHLCCGSAGTYNILQPEIATKLGRRKVENLERLDVDVIATGNVGCTVQIASFTHIPVVHTVELLDWATGGPPPPALSRLDLRPRGDA
jgi:glycolate oxidase iron-sulfur subunit